ncbi:MAG: TonB-dependent receptor [Ginsengibacter sp.]
MKIFCFILTIGVCVFLSLPASAQKNSVRYSLSGKITDVSGGALGGASAYIPDMRKGSVADDNGNYFIGNIPSGTYLVEIRSLGYKTVLQNIYFNENKVQNFPMEIAVTEENDIVVTASSKATSIRRNPIPIVSINRQFLQQNLNTNIIDAIARVPGVSEVTTGPNVSKPFIRGLGFNRILTLYDGVRQEGQQWGDEHGIEVDQNTVDKVEVVKGPASLIYGSDAVAGVVNLIPANPPAEGKIIGNILNEYQTNNRLIENSATIAAHTGDYTWGGTFTHKMATNYTDKYDGRVYNTGFAETDVSANAGVSKNWGYSRLGLSMFNDLQEIPDGSRDSASRRFTKQITEEDAFRPIVSESELNTYKISDLHQHVQHYRMYSASSLLVGNGRLAVNLAFQKSIRREYSHPEVQVPGLYLKLDTYSYDVKYYFHESKGLSVTTGINGMYQNNNVNSGTEFIIPSYHQFDFGPFIYAKKTLGKLEIAGGIRYDVRYFSNDGLYSTTDPVTGFDHVVTGADTVGASHPFSSYKHTFSGGSGSLGLSYRINHQFSVKANIGRGYRAPNISEISANGVHPGTGIYQIGNLNFKPEFNLQEDLGVEFNSTHVTVNADVFNNTIQNYIYNQKLGSAMGGDSVIVPGNQTFKFVAAKANLYGGELTVDVHPHPWDWLHFENSLSVVYGTNEGVPGEGKMPDSAKYLPFIPPLHTISELRANIKKVGNTFANAFVKVQFEVFATQNRAYLENGTETPTAGYQLVNAGFGANILNKGGKPFLNVSFMGNNLLNVAYQSGLNRLKYFEQYPGNFTGHDGIYNMGRNFSIRVDVPLNFKG